MKKLYVVGNRASKSLSPTIFNYWFKKYNIKASYGYLELTKKNFHKKIKEVLEKKDTLGLHVTIPFKSKIIKHLGKIDTHAKKIRHLRGKFCAYFINTNVDAKTSQVFPMTHIHTGIDQGVESTP